MTSVRGRDRQLNTKRSKAANAGFSLVELLIAVTILAIIVIPLLHMFVTSTRINVKSRQTLRATTVAQDIMEGLKAYNLEEVRTQFSLPDGTISSDFFYPTEGFYIVNSKMIQGGVREIKELETPRDDEGNFVNPDDDDNEIYYFGIENLKLQGGEYDALIRLDASTYTDVKAGGSGHDNAFNGKYYADTKSVSETSGGSERDSSYHEHSEMNKNVLADIKKLIKDDLDDAGDTTHDAELEAFELEDLIEKRYITVEIEDAGSNDAEGNPQCKATITFKYICRDPFGYCMNTSANPEENGKYVSYGKEGSTSGLVKDIPRTFSSGNFYLFYYPIYKTNVDNILFDIKDSTVLFDKEQPLLKSITLAKQIRSVVDVTNNVIAPDLTDAELFAAESSYAAKMDIKINSTMESNLLFRTNFDTNMSQQAKKQAEASGDPDDMVIWNARPGGGFANSHIKLTDMVGNNVSDKVTNVIYDIEITVYKTGAAKHFKEGPGFESSDEVQRLATITNLD